MADRLVRDGLAVLTWTVTFVVVGGALALALTASLGELIIRGSVVGPVITATVTAVGGTAATLLGRRYPPPDGVQPEPRTVLVACPAATVVVAVLSGPAWDTAAGGLVATLATVLLLAGDRATR